MQPISCTYLIKKQTNSNSNFYYFYFYNCYKYISIVHNLTLSKYSLSFRINKLNNYKYKYNITLTSLEKLK